MGARWRAGGREKEKIILKGFGFLYFNPKSYSLTLGLSPSCALFLSPIISPILSGDFQWELVEKKDSSSSDVSAICHARKGKKKHPLSLKKKKKRWRNAASRNKNTTKDGSDAASKRTSDLLHYHTGLMF